MLHWRLVVSCAMGIAVSKFSPCLMHGTRPPSRSGIACMQGNIALPCKEQWWVALALVVSWILPSSGLSAGLT